ncbi:uncharacterized protein LOC122252501 [Penaeus japonicus]|uniref:uncharacterized protein LOC122252501 n=1 Tax=Penaeus japonicus TaxID=27405 RepID=UPI001C713DEB|nr:uncharacterized protein LOC122252501 [Penaeus japonicus]
MWVPSIVRAGMVLMVTLSPHTTHAGCQALFEGSLISCATPCLVPRDGTMPICALGENEEVKWGVCSVDCSADYCDEECQTRIMKLNKEASRMHMVSASPACPTVFREGKAENQIQGMMRESGRRKRSAVRVFRGFRRKYRGCNLHLELSC